MKSVNSPPLRLLALALAGLALEDLLTAVFLAGDFFAAAVFFAGAFLAAVFFLAGAFFTAVFLAAAFFLAFFFVDIQHLLPVTNSSCPQVDIHPARERQVS
ncbi:MAG: hypothetical protein GC149_06655 [Gammaproteobacteria bacterium]|nr:hypothetical protein [Gammaproteobacteria bacterium]